MNIYLIYGVCAGLLLGTVLLGVRTYRLQQRIRTEIGALRVEKRTKAQQADMLAMMSKSRVEGYVAVTNPEVAPNTYYPTTVNKAVDIQNSYSL